MAWHPKFIDGRIDFVNGDKTTITVYSTIDSDCRVVTLENRILKAFWDEFGLCVQTEDGEKILITCTRHHPEKSVITSFRGGDIITPALGEKIRREADIQRHRQECLMARYDKFIQYSYNDPDAQYDDEILQSVVLQIRSEIKKTRDLARQGDSEAQNKVGNYYKKGIGVSKDDAEAVRWYRLAAEQGLALAQDNLGWMYQNGLGVEQNYIEAVNWYCKAADQGYANAQNNMGWMYQNGLGVTQDDAEAVRWYRLAAEQGLALAQDTLGWMYQNGLGVEQNYIEAVNWYCKAADQGNANAQNNMGWMYQNGLGVTQDDAEAVKWYRLAAEQGNTYAQNNLKKLTE